jgi:hypothetical protein
VRLFDPSFGDTVGMISPVDFNSNVVFGLVEKDRDLPVERFWYRRILKR